MTFIAVICGLKSEQAAVQKALDGRNIRIGVSGANAERAYDLAKGFCADGAAAIISVGVSGGLDPLLKPGDLVIGDEVIADESGEIFASDAFLLGAMRKTATGAGARAVRLFGADGVIDSAARKAVLFSNWKAQAVDMESHGAARAAAAARVPFIAIRAIADPVSRALPPAALNAIAPDGSTRVLATLAAALRDPKQFPALMMLGADSSKALKTLKAELPALAAAIEKAIERI